MKDVKEPTYTQFITGGTGFIGQPLTQCLLQRNWKVIILVRKPESSSTQALSKMGAQLVTGDVTERVNNGFC